MRSILIAAILTIVSGCSSLPKKTSLINNGDDKSEVLKVMGPPDDRQFKGEEEAWQYCENAGFGVHDHRLIWLHRGKVTGINTYKSHVMGSCTGGIQPVIWQNAPDITIETRSR